MKGDGCHSGIGITVIAPHEQVRIQNAMVLILLLTVADLRPDACHPVQRVFADDHFIGVAPDGQAVIIIHIALQVVEGDKVPRAAL